MDGCEREDDRGRVEGEQSKIREKERKARPAHLPCLMTEVEPKISHEALAGVSKLFRVDRR